MARKGWASELALSVFGLELRHCVFDDDRQLAGKKLNEFSCADFEFDPGSLPRIEQEVIPEGRRDDLIYSDVPNVTQPLGFNPLERVPPLKRPLAASGLLDVFKKIWADSWRPRLEYILRNTARAPGPARSDPCRRAAALG